MSSILNPSMWGESIKLSIQEGFDNVIEGINSSISNAFNNVMVKTGSFILEGVCIFIVYFMIFTAFKVMITVDRGKQEKNMNVIGITAGVYMVVRMIVEIVRGLI